MVRLANIVPGIFRKALQDVEIKGAHMHMAGISCAPIRRRKKMLSFQQVA
jgi:hypothetical protein